MNALRQPLAYSTAISKEAFFHMINSIPTGNCRGASRTHVTHKWVTLAFVLVGLLVVAPPAHSVPSTIDQYGIEHFDASAAGTAAGGHSDITTTLKLTSEGEPFARTRDVIVETPPGVVGNPTVVPTCSLAKFEHLDCPLESQVGTSLVDSPALGGILYSPVFRISGTDDFPARFAMWAAIYPITLNATVRADGDWGIDIAAESTPAVVAMKSTVVNLWGVPADPSHDDERFTSVESLLCDGPCGGPIASHMPPKAFLSNPTQCASDLTFHVRARSYPRPEIWHTASDSLGRMTDCQSVPFDPRIGIRPTTSQADTPSGLGVDIELPQAGLTEPTGRATAHLKRVRTILPEGMTVNPSSSDGLGACTPSQIALSSNEPARCPDSSKIGTVEVETPVLEEKLSGGIYLAEQGNNPFGSLMALYMVAEGSGAIFKLPGHVELNPETGRLVTTFDGNPQQPFSKLSFRLNGGSRAPLVTPSTCGTHETVVELSPWSADDPDNPTPDEVITLTSQFTIDRGPDGGPCLPPNNFEPGFEAGTVTPIAGAYSPLVINASRPDGSTRLTGLRVQLPPGLIGRLAGVSYCSDAALLAAEGRDGTAEAVAPSCPADSRLGLVDVATGAGPSPYHVQGAVYLAGPYKGAPLSAAVVTPAVAGPFDLGTVVVRSALRVDPVTAQIGVESDPIPQLLEGIPLAVRSVHVNANRPQFTLNPTSCEETSAQGTLFSSSLVRSLSSRFQVGACAALGLKPRLEVRLRGGTARGANPALEAVLRPRAGDANIKRTVVRLPRTAFLEQANIRTVCTRVQFAADACPKASIYGRVTAYTPLLDKPLRGPAYLRSSDNKLPDLVFDLHGTIDIEASARIDSIKGGIRATFSAIPDAPISRVVVSMQGGKRKGLIVNSRDLCAARSRANVRFDGHNGRASEQRPLVRPVACERRRAAKRPARSSKSSPARSNAEF